MAVYHHRQQPAAPNIPIRLDPKTDTTTTRKINLQLSNRSKVAAGQPSRFRDKLSIDQCRLISLGSILGALTSDNTGHALQEVGDAAEEAVAGGKGALAAVGGAGFVGAEGAGFAGCGGGAGG